MTTTDLPRWSAADIYESIGSRAFVDDVESLDAGATRLEALFDEHDVRRCEPRDVSAADGAAADAVLAAHNEHQTRHLVAAAFVHSIVATDSRDERAQAMANRLAVIDARVRPLTARLADWVQSLGVAALAEVSNEAREHEGPLERLSERANHQMPEAEESLYAALAPTGSGSWQRLHADVTSQLDAEVLLPSGVERVPMSTARGMASHHDPAVRRAAYEAELRAWPSVEVPCAAALNGVKGEAVVVNARRGWSDPVDASLFANSVTRATFDALQRAVVSALPDFRRWMRAKAHAHGIDGALPWTELAAPHPDADHHLAWSQGVDSVRAAFAAYHPSLGALVDRALDEQWIDAEPRSGKRGGAFCMPIGGDRSMVFLNWTDSTNSMLTLAHELGHAYHNAQLGGRTPLQRQLPMALAETASIFCETLTLEAAVATADPRAQLSLLDADLCGANQLVVDIHSRFLFEQAVFTRRATSTLGPGELCEMMRAAQSSAYGDGLDQATAHPYMWAVKPHYYGSHFYNWPYTYGYLFGLGLFACFHDDPERFRARYDDALSRVGMASAETLAADFGLDVTDEAFWQASLDVLRLRIGRYADLVGAPAQ
jgi:oligoendopeptidase F